VYAGGDIVTGAATVIEAMGAGRKAAASILAYLGVAVPASPPAAPFGLPAGQRNFLRLQAA
jgi:glutamate synthase (NADPH/NADH) small chain